MQEFKKWEDLTITDDFMFCKVMSDPDICKELLEILLHIKIERLEFQEPQKSFKLTSESRGIRLDVYVKDSNRVFDIELQTTNERNLELRTRYYQGVMDISELEKGEFYSNMKESYIIFICMFDPFGADMPIYTVKQTFTENEKLIFDDKTHKIFYNVNAFEKLSNDVETKAFLEYLCKHQSTTKFTQSLETAVYRNKNNQNWRQDYMTLAHDMYMVAKEAAEEAAKEAFEDGFSAGEERGRNEGINIGRSEGISIGLSQGAHKKAIETAKNLLSIGLSLEQIALVTGLSIETIQELANK